MAARPTGSPTVFRPTCTRKKSEAAGKGTRRHCARNTCPDPALEGYARLTEAQLIGPRVVVWIGSLIAAELARPRRRRGDRGHVLLVVGARSRQTWIEIEEFFWHLVHQISTSNLD